MKAEDVIGRVTRCSTRGFTGAYPLGETEVPAFGSFCEAPFQADGYAIGVIYDINIEDDPLARQLAIMEDVPDEQILDSQKNRQVPVEFSVINLGYRLGDRSFHTLPPRPPLTLDPVRPLPDDALMDFTSDLSYISTITANPAVPVDDLLIAAIGYAILIRPEDERQRYVMQAGRSLARILAGDLHRLEQILHNLSQAFPEFAKGSSR